MITTFVLSFNTFAAGSMCSKVFQNIEINPSGLLSPDGKREAFLSEDRQLLKIINKKNKTEYTFDSFETLNGFFSLDGHAWIMPRYNEIHIWNFERSEGNLIRVILKNVLSKPSVIMHKDSTTGDTILKISYLRKKINPDNQRYFETTETILKNLKTFEESRF